MLITWKTNQNCSYIQWHTCRWHTNFYDYLKQIRNSAAGMYSLLKYWSSNSPTPQMNVKVKFYEPHQRAYRLRDHVQNHNSIHLQAYVLTYTCVERIFYQIEIDVVTNCGRMRVSGWTIDCAAFTTTTTTCWFTVAVCPRDCLTCASSNDVLRCSVCKTGYGMDPTDTSCHGELACDVTPT